MLLYRNSRPFINTCRSLLSGSLFLLAVDLKKYDMSRKDFQVKVGDWVSIVAAKVPSAVILIVPTHIDQFTDNEQSLIMGKSTDILNKLIKQEDIRMKAIEKEIKQRSNENEKSTQQLTQMLNHPPIFPKVVLVGSPILLRINIVIIIVILCEYHLL